MCGLADIFSFISKSQICKKKRRDKTFTRWSLQLENWALFTKPEHLKAHKS